MNYGDVATREKVGLCINPNQPHRYEMQDHRRGYTTSDGVIHWLDRKVNRLGLRRFLMMAAAIKYSHNRGQPRWQQVYEQNEYAYHRALAEYHIRLPRRYSLTDRARVRYWMGQEKGALTEHAYAARWAMERD